MSPRPQAFGLVLAAGASRRARGAKALMQHDGRPLIVCALTTLREGGCQRAMAVVAPPHVARIRAAVDGAHLLELGTPEQGMFGSLKRGAEVARAFGYSVMMASLVDHPRVAPATVAALLDAYRESPAELLRPVHAGRRGHPILIAGALLERVARAPATSHTRHVLDTALDARDVEVNDVEVNDPAIHQDLDTARDLRRALGRT